MLFQIFILVLVLLLSLLAVLIVPKVKGIRDYRIKTIAYIVLGIIGFSLVGVAYNMWQPNGMKDAVSLLQPYVQFYPIFILSIILAAVTLITYMDREKYGYIFAGAGFAVLLPDLMTYVSNGRYDLILLGCALWALMPVAWAFMWKENVYFETRINSRIITAIKAGLITYPIYLVTAIVALFGESHRGFDLAGLTDMSVIMSDAVKFLLVSLWLYLLVSVIIVSLMFIIHDLALHTLSFKRVVSKNGDIQYVKEEKPVDAGTMKGEGKQEAYRGLIGEMEVFYKYMNSVDRIKAASTIARFKSEYQTLAVRYNDPSKVEADRMIKALDQEFKNRYQGGI